MTVAVCTPATLLHDLRGVKGEMLVIRCPDVTLTRPVRLLHPRMPLYIVPRGDGVYMLGATMIESEDSSRITARSMLELLSAAYALNPAFGEAEVLEIGVDLRPAFPDNLPRIRRLGRTIYANGLYRHGYLLALRWRRAWPIWRWKTNIRRWSMKIVLNGEAREVLAPGPCSELLAECGYSGRVATAVNEEFVPSSLAGRPQTVRRRPGRGCRTDAGGLIDEDVLRHRTAQSADAGHRAISQPGHSGTRVSRQRGGCGHGLAAP